MARDRYAVLSELNRLAGAPASTRTLKKILCLLADRLQVSEISLYTIDSRNSTATLLLQAGCTGLPSSPPSQTSDSPEMQAVLRQQPLTAQGRYCLPLGSAGVLSVPAEVGGDPEQRLMLEVAGGLLGGQLRQIALADRERRLSASRAFQDELVKALAGVVGRSEMLRAAVSVIQRRTRAAGVVLRPVFGSAVLGRGQVRFGPAWRSCRPLFLAMEREHAWQALSERETLLLPLTAEVCADALPVTMAVVPVLAGERPVGVLTLFVGRDKGPLALEPAEEGLQFLSVVGSLLAQALERAAAQEELAELAAEDAAKLREATVLYRISRAMHSTLRLNELMHLLLSAATSPDGGGFERAMLFMVNARSSTLQGMLCVTRDNFALVLPPELGPGAWEHPVVTADAMEAQRAAPCCRKVMQQRLALDDDNPLSRSVRRGRVVFVSRPDGEQPAAAHFAEALQLAPYACAPLRGRERPLGILVVDNPLSRRPISADHRRFLELFAGLAGAAMENSLLLHRLETTHTELHETRELLIQGEKMAVLGEMAASVAHEIKNPLVSIGGFAQRLKRGAAGEREREYAGIIAREVHRLEELLVNILAFAKKQMLCFGDCNPVALIDAALEMELDALARTGVRLEKKIATELPIIQADEQKLQQVLLNLITNARQVMPQGGTLSVRAHRGTLRGEPAMVVEVADTGGGIPRHILENIFEPFFTTKEQGTGLGLSISRRIVEQHRGEIEVRNRGEGAVFILRLPVRAAAALR